MSALKFDTTHVFREHWFSVGIEATTGLYFLSLPVSARIFDYTEYYRLTEEQYQTFIKDPTSADPFAEECRRQQHDDLLMVKPPPINRGTAI